jgi:hypothetical protein
MNAEILLPEVIQDVAAPARPAQAPIDQVVAAIRQDSRIEAGKYLDEVVVPHGGE